MDLDKKDSQVTLDLKRERVLLGNRGSYYALVLLVFMAAYRVFRKVLTGYVEDQKLSLDWFLLDTKNRSDRLAKSCKNMTVLPKPSKMRFFI